MAGSSRMVRAWGVVLAALPGLLVGACESSIAEQQPAADGGQGTAGGESALGGEVGNGKGGGPGMAGDGGAHDEHEPCEITLEAFEHNGYRTCSPTAPAADACAAVFLDFGRQEECNGMHIYAWGHDGRIGCAYSEATGQLVGGFLWGLPVSGKSCSSYFAGPASLSACPIPSTPYCDSAAGGAGGAGGVAGAGGAAGGP